MNALLAQLGIVCPRCDVYNLPKSATCAACNADLGFGDFADSAKPATVGRMAAAPKAVTSASVPAASAAPTPVATKPASAGTASAARFRLVAVKGTVGPGSAFKLAGQSVSAGRSKGILLFPNDPFVAPLHCTFFYKESRLFVRDESSPSGTFVTVAKEAIAPNTFFAVGDTLLRYLGPLPAPAPAAVLHYGAPLPSQPLYLLEEILDGLRPGRCLARPGPVVTVGATGCEFLIAADAGVAPRHCEVAFSPQGATLKDLGTPAGTFLRLAPGAERELKVGEQVRIGNEILRVEAA
jgi:pSer/pThr/pTyr-binding forkhead associated (FHA) protein